jgi:dolichol-phosphate mannosyltransferase
MCKLTVVIPTRNEAQSLPRVISDLAGSFNGLNYKILVVDDGDDNTPQILNKMAYQQVEFLRRPVSERNGLSGAVIQGFRRANSTYIAVMDGDGQHPPELIRRMLWLAQNEEIDMIMASRYVSGASADGLEDSLRHFYSGFLRQMPRFLFSKLRKVTDPLGGCFLVRTRCLRLDNLRPIGWKISLEVLLFSDIRSYQEVSYGFRKRIGGESKANFKVGIEYFRQLISLALRYFLPSSQTH